MAPGCADVGPKKKPLTAALGGNPQWRFGGESMRKRFGQSVSTPTKQTLNVQKSLVKHLALNTGGLCGI